jgi:hypothetical protein
VIIMPNFTNLSFDNDLICTLKSYIAVQGDIAPHVAGILFNHNKGFAADSAKPKVAKKYEI